MKNTLYKEIIKSGKPVFITKADYYKALERFQEKLKPDLDGIEKARLKAIEKSRVKVRKG